MLFKPNIHSKLEDVNFYQKIKQSPLANVSISFVSTTLLIIILFSLAIRPSVIKVLELRNQINKMNIIVTKLSKKSKVLSEIIPKYQKLKKTQELAELAIPNNPDIPLFERQINYLLKKNDLKTELIKLPGFDVIGKSEEKNKKEAINNPVAMPFEIQGSGDYKQIKSFIQQLQFNIRLIKIDKINLVSNRSGIIKFILTGNVLYWDNDINKNK